MTERPGVLLLTRDSAFQRYLANRLWRAGWLTGVICESGASAPQAGASGARAGLRRLLGDALRHPIRTGRRVRNKLRHEAFYGRQAEHNARILQSGYESFDAALPVVRVADVNDAEARDAIARLRPGIVIVFGTRLVKPATMQALGCPAINLHWGWSPDYRGEGIVTALALEGPGALGVTVHHLAEGVDDGDLLRRARPALEPGDNFYAIGLRLTRLGAELIEDVLARFSAGEEIGREPQDLSAGRNRGSKFMREHPELMSRAYRRLTEARR